MSQVITRERVNVHYSTNCIEVLARDSRGITRNTTAWADASADSVLLPTGRRSNHTLTLTLQTFFSSMAAAQEFLNSCVDGH